MIRPDTSATSRFIGPIAFAFGFAIMLALGMPALAQLTDAEQEARDRLEEILNSITLSEDRAQELSLEIEAMEGDRAQQNAALIAAGQRVLLAEIEVTDIEERLTGLQAREAEISERLAGADRDVGGVLAALQRIGRDPPPALIVDPSDALGSARGAILISAILPQLRERADAITADLDALETVKLAALEEEGLLRANLLVLQEEQLRIATLIEARRQGVVQVNEEIAAREREAEALAAEADTLNELIDNLQARIAAAELASEAREAAAAGSSVPALSEETIRLALTNPERTAPAVPFAQARGYLTVPTAGVTVLDFGDDDHLGGTAEGTSIVTRADAQVVAPADGWVLYRGPYLNYGQIIIFDAGQGYTVLLAGLEELAVEQGQFVQMGEPVGTMGSRTLGRAVTTDAGVSQPTLYIELRSDNEPVDPEGWWDTQATPTQSG